MKKTLNAPCLCVVENECDASCVCKDDWFEDVTADKGFFEKLFDRWFREYAFPVVYADGFVSRRKSECKKRKPIGIVWQGYFISAAWGYCTDWHKAIEHAKTTSILGIQPTAGDAEFWNSFIHSGDLRAVNRLFERIGGTPLKKAYRWTTSSKGECAVIWDFDGLSLALKNYEGYSYRAVFPIKNLVS